MKFGKVADPSHIDFTLPPDHPATEIVLRRNENGLENISIGCAKWNRTDLKGFYPKGTKDELRYYATQFNSIELNATFYGMPTPEQILTWKDKTPEHFKFFPKITNTISHFRRLIDVTDAVTQFATAVAHFEEKLGMVFLQLHDNFQPKDYNRLEKFVRDWPEEIPVAIELRNAEWFSDEAVFNKTCELFEDHNITNIIVDTPGRRDMLHMRLTTPNAFIRYVATDSQHDYKRLDAWLAHLAHWKQQGLRNLCFFVHQDIGSFDFLSAHFIKRMNDTWKTSIHIPQMAAESTGTLF
ncbi:MULTISPECIES: DUF72 domain-containing protein [Chryseobacterium]|uniref:Uncharacterized protein YecE (DUF72 family) n=1 Tax=Chryseobacterium camelliae TaxID=1265445 RepID=A0ABU0TDR8_9FLAO|nr:MULTISPECIES: DUF72 domain-containing protein [Chryseobacterium]MDT3407118.1 uncharacterized protein YecE (DUF72 family) [Pseudacidovorax intermedius]MDQ1095091.1 uncharacterized protein YecE (DUF72 family) [Chryseobacterium camelliae]MDQ1099029.1 uncharacterized protein YecE (DUF72 family) [Chryseobacterium sp. SORGH_AS_1048]MDR6086377.1 uncharacterized protein YecE (DUF72 family) [Chryseobacterium sp. SORGH_AS_0909]MDR6130750.1 uncharacterized protein YecE (DUF72 family) [Chryseobacterium